MPNFTLSHLIAIEKSRGYCGFIDFLQSACPASSFSNWAELLSFVENEKGVVYFTRLNDIPDNLLFQHEERGLQFGVHLLSEDGTYNFYEDGENGSSTWNLGLYKKLFNEGNVA